MSSSKRCKGCGEVKPLTEFYALRPGHSGRVSAGHFAECKICNTARAVAWQKANPGKAAASRARYARNRKLREVYGITPAEYEALLTAQDGKCEICGTSDPGRG